MTASPHRKQMRLPGGLVRFLPALDLGLRLLCDRSPWPDLPPRDARVRVSLTPAQEVLIAQLQELRPQPANAIVAAALLCASQAPAFALPPELLPRDGNGYDGTGPGPVAGNP